MRHIVYKTLSKVFVAEIKWIRWFWVSMVKLVQKYAISDPRHSSLAKTKRLVPHISKKCSVTADIC